MSADQHARRTSADRLQDFADQQALEQASQTPPQQHKPCRHDSTRRDGSLDDHCLRCGVDGYWHFGHRHDEAHPSGKVLIILGCPDSEPECES